uniref:30S ribosomal protein S2 n=1 Tax=Gymnochlora stellata TaxID=67809 RepID=A0A140JZJ4_GYMST|nr:30S ribosomal protein S2 [Gymnochlora stellata]BAU62521.1 30S ribosomal protein S2 [Gymnochlora stellata]
MNIELKQMNSLFFISSSLNSNYLIIEEKRKEDKIYQFILKMVKAGVHFGHKVREWNPKMSPFIYQKLDGIHIIDIIQSYIYLKKICKLLFTQAASSDYNTFLFVGTQKQTPIPNCIVYNASQCNSLYINNKWLSGLLTNWENAKKSINTLNYLSLYQKTNNFDNLTMKVRSLLEKKKERLQKYFGGVQNMKTLPNFVVLVGQQNEMIALKECQKLQIKNVTLLDTDCNPELADFFIPANDDSSSSLNLILGELRIAINLGRQKFCEKSTFKNTQLSVFDTL